MSSQTPTMAKRELSSTLRNLKFMQRASLKEETKKEEEEEVKKSNDNLASANIPKRRCKVIMEGNPHPGASRGRMSFQSFNPSIDKLNEAAASPCEPSSSDAKTSDSENGLSRTESKVSKSLFHRELDGEYQKRKQPETVAEAEYPNKLPRNTKEEIGQRSLPKKNDASNKQRKSDRLDWNLLKPPKAQNRSS
ncbi:hypothetical protein GIB67_034033 [Kingdonia uniflora]|uniref:M-phase phosphoprotein 6 n=1 Tax=Kingdonia uniflora TaxID=39325 RepID=A0A7J7M6D8_9MAGN|nr:hypothetical protein GIB67_034033 [Kingdonia uniflora]